jgi:predicted nucleotidyltransferase
MKIAGIITEYNPLHNGHLYQLNWIRRELHPDLMIIVMSGDFVQRGEPAVLSKWDRTQWALRAGADLVFELPYIFSVGKADIFALGAVSILDQAGATHLIFGSEDGRIDAFIRTVDLIEAHHAAYDRALMNALHTGLSYPNAHAAAYRLIAEREAENTIDLTRPNNSLGFHYIRAIRKLNSSMTPITLKRIQSDHSDPGFHQDARIASSTSIRSHLLNQQADESLENKVPDYVYSLLMNRKTSGCLMDWNACFPYLKYRLLSSTPGQLKEIYECEEGIEHRLLSCIRSAESFRQFIGMVKTKRYTWSRLQRLSTHILTHTLKEEVREPAQKGELSYLRPLGMNSKGQNWLSHMRKQFQVPLISKIHKHHPPLLDADLRAAGIYDFISGRASSFLPDTGQIPLRFNEIKGLFQGNGSSRQ